MSIESVLGRTYGVYRYIQSHIVRIEIWQPNNEVTAERSHQQHAAFSSIISGVSHMYRERYGMNILPCCFPQESCDRAGT
jgi:hypothetical protein